MEQDDDNREQVDIGPDQDYQDLFNPVERTLPDDETELSPEAKKALEKQYERGSSLAVAINLIIRTDEHRTTAIAVEDLGPTIIRLAEELHAYVYDGTIPEPEEDDVGGDSMAV